MLLAIKKFLYQLVHSLMVQLTFLHFKKNLALLTVWIIIIAAYSGGIGRVYGIHYLFLDPEYLGKVSFWSFFFMGVTFGNLVMAWHITIYILDSHRFRFIGMLERPFAKFSINNSLIPLTTLIIYMILIVRFQLKNELAEKSEIILYLLGLFSGIFILQFLMWRYFRFTNKDIFKLLTGTVDKRLKKTQLSRGHVMNKLKENKKNQYRVTNYLDLRLRARPTKKIVGFNNKEAILKVFDQNHFNSVIVELIIIGIILLLGLLMHNKFLQIPAAASALLIFAIAVMLVGAMNYWFKSWSLLFALGIFILINISVKMGLIKRNNEATGLDYDTIKSVYSVEWLLSSHSKAQYTHDHRQMLETMENWKTKFENPKDEKMVFLCVSGGGQRAALWTVNALLEIDSVLNGSLMDQVFLISGASGGLIGSAYYREVFLQNPKTIISSKARKELLTNMGKDNLNPIIFSLLVNDLFFNLQTYQYAGRTYRMDRGYTFERNLNKNLGNVLDKKISDYLKPEKQGKIPTLIMSPTIANDGRKLYISAQPVSFMGVSFNTEGNRNRKIQGTDFQMLFKNNSPHDLSFLAALRMAASFPYITPNIRLPSTPSIEIVDAGISDNFGVSDALKFINIFKDWIIHNTDGIVLLVIRDTKSNFPIERVPPPSMIDRITYPIASVYNNLTNMQDINNHVRIERMKNWFSAEFNTIEIVYDSFQDRKGNASEAKRASLSWHLTAKEKKNIIENIQIEENQQAIKHLQQLLGK